MNENSSKKTSRTKANTADWRASFREAGPYLGLGMQLAAAMAFFSGIGYLADLQFKTLPWLTVAGGLIGMVAVFVQLVRVTNRSNSPRTGQGPNDASA